MKNQIIEKIRKAVVASFFASSVIVLSSCGYQSGTDGLSSWQEEVLDSEIKDEELTELEAVEHQGESAKTYSVVNETFASEPLFVYVCGKVNRPGVYELPSGSRIYEAIESAGGMTEDARVEAINQALLCEDGMQITVPGQDDEILQEIKAKEKGLINLNTADVATLTTLKGIGETRAEAIVAYREENGLFKAKEDVMNVPGIKQGAYEKIKDSITVY